MQTEFRPQRFIGNPAARHNNNLCAGTQGSENSLLAWVQTRCLSLWLKCQAIRLALLIAHHDGVRDTFKILIVFAGAHFAGADIACG